LGLPGRDPATMAKVASALDYEHEWEIYSKKLKTAPLRSCSYSLEAREFCFAENPEHRKKMIDLYGDGASPTYIIATRDIYGEPLVYSEISPEMGQIAESGHVPFIGCWFSPGGACAGVSVLVDHGVSDEAVLAMLARHNQQHAAKVTLEKMAYFPPE